MMDCLRDLKPPQAMAASLLFQHRRLLLSLPRQEGKTELGVRLLHDITRRKWTSSSLFLAKDKKSGKKATREKFMRIFDPKVFSVNTELVYLKEHPTSAIFMDSVDKDPERLRGGTYSMIHWSEVAFSKIEAGATIADVYGKVIQPTMRKTKGYVLLESTNNGKNGWYDIWENYKELGFRRLKFSLSDLVYLGIVTREEYDEIQRETLPLTFKQEYECDFVTFAGKTYDEFEEHIHVDQTILAPAPWQKTLMAIDWGYNPSATCVLFAYVAGGQLLIYDEHYQKEELTEITAMEIQKRFHTYGVGSNYAGCADHDPKANVELTNRGIPVGLAQKVDVLGARMQIKELLYFNRIKIHPRCKNLIRDLQAATWDTKKKKDGEINYDQCTWGHFDAEAALRYLVRELSGFESEEPDFNPHVKGADPLSALAYEMNRHRYGMGMAA
jgi:hypothetical protein